MPRKLRRSIDSRTASFAKDLVETPDVTQDDRTKGVRRPSKIKDPRVRFAVLNVALACIGLTTQIQQVASSCKTAQQVFASVFPEDNEAKDHAIELFENLGMLIMNATEGQMSEAIETLVVLAMHAADSDGEVRTLSLLAQSLGLDTSDIALDEEEVPRQAKTTPESSEPRAPATCLFSSDDRLRIEAVAQVAITRRLPIVTAEADGTRLMLVGYTEDRNRAERLCELDCDFAEAQRIVVLMTRLVEKGLP